MTNEELLAALEALLDTNKFEQGLLVIPDGAELRVISCGTSRTELTTIVRSLNSHLNLLFATPTEGKAN